MANKKGTEARTTTLETETWNHLEEQAKKNGRSIPGQIRYYLNKIISGEFIIKED